MSNISMSDAELLKFAIENGMLDAALVQEKIEMQKRTELLEMHKYDIWQGTNGKWYTYLPDEQKGRRLIKRTTEKDIEDSVVNYYRLNSEEDKRKKEIESITLKSLFPKWIKHKQMHTDSSSYIKRITADWNRFYSDEEELINKPIRNLDKMYLDEWAHKMIKDNGLTKKSYYNMSVILRQCLDYAVEMKYIDKNIFSEVKINTKMFARTKKKTSTTQVFTELEEEKLINDMFRRFKRNPKSTAPLAVILSFELGTRIGEMCALKFSDIDGNYINIQRQEVREFEFTDEYSMKFSGFKIVEYTKTEDGNRGIYLTETAKNIIELVKMVNKMNGESCDDFVFVKDGENINHYSIQAMIKRGCENIDILVKTSHKIRKTYISKLIDSGLNIDEIRRMAGHADERTTFNSYCFNRLTDAQTEEKIEMALRNTKVIKGNQKIVDFVRNKNPENLTKSRLSGK